jgi:2-succinyl-6-hydroxy-2,4-cyclohexadiene-1-carboxylate synthase
MTRVALPDGDLEVAMAGHGPPLLLLHGFTGTAGTWSAVIEACRSDRRTVAPDLLGHGRSAAPSDRSRYALERQADDLVSLLDRFDALPADVVGYSMGARIALVLALEHPDAVTRLVLESPSAGIAGADDHAARSAADEALARRLERDGIEAFAEAWERQPALASQAELPAPALDRLRRERRGHDPAGLAASLRGAGQGAMAPLHDRLGTIAAPVLVIAGERDAVGLDRARVVAGGIPGARLAVVDGAGHSPHLERATTFIDLVARFLGIEEPVPAH